MWLVVTCKICYSVVFMFGSYISCQMKKLYSWHDVAKRTEIVYDRAVRCSNQNLLERLSRYGLYLWLPASPNCGHSYGNWSSLLWVWTVDSYILSCIKHFSWHGNSKIKFWWYLNQWNILVDTVRNLTWSGKVFCGVTHLLWNFV